MLITIIALLCFFVIGFITGIAVARKYALQADAAVKEVEAVADKVESL